MPNFLYAVATYADGHTETFEHRLWCLGGVKDEEGHAKLNKLKQDHATGIIIKLTIEYES